MIGLYKLPAKYQMIHPRTLAVAGENVCCSMQEPIYTRSWMVGILQMFRIFAGIQSEERKKGTNLMRMEMQWHISVSLSAALLLYGICPRVNLWGVACQGLLTSWAKVTIKARPRTSWSETYPVFWRNHRPFEVGL
jgi:hypothetical protein